MRATEKTSAPNSASKNLTACGAVPHAARSPNKPPLWIQTAYVNDPRISSMAGSISSIFAYSSSQKTWLAMPSIRSWL